MPDLFQHGGFAFRLLEDLRQSKASDFLGGFTSADAPLSTAQSLKKVAGNVSRIASVARECGGVA